MGEDPLARGGLASLLAGAERVAVAAQAALEDDLPAAVEAARPGAAVVDLSGERRAALRALRDLSDLEVPAVALCPGAEAAAAAQEAGARGALLRSAGAPQIEAALVAASAGLVAFERSLAPALSARAPVEGELGLALTPRELEVLQLLSLGLSNKEIGARLSISEHTAKFHVNAILGKLGVQGRTEAVVRAARLGLVVL